MKILMMIPLWKRAEIVQMFMLSMERTLPVYANLIPFFILSHEDPQHKELSKLIAGHHYCEYKNNPLGEKKNAGLYEALKLDWDYYMDMGSDNIWTTLLWDLYEELFNDGIPYFGCRNMYSIDLKQSKAVFNNGYHVDVWEKVTALGIGRCIRRDVVEQLVPLWRGKFQRGMDGCSHFKIAKAGYKCQVIDNEETPCLLDIKTDTNITPFIKQQLGGKSVEVKKVYEWFGLHRLNIYVDDNTGIVPFEDFREQVLSRVRIYGNQQQAFNVVNSTYEDETGEKRYKNYLSYRVVQSKKFKK